jgi:16S rRNA (adenine1518-N6/adenine1519-N6)-dimethyltransferase
MTAQTRSHIKDLLARHGVNPRTSWGQHFLADPNVIDRVVRTAAIAPGDRVLEVGPGTGTLTRALAARGAEVTAIEFDLRLQPILAEELAGLHVDLIWGDAMDVDYKELTRASPWKGVANLPYQVGTPLLLDWLRLTPNLVEFTLMMQLEVAQRLTAAPRSDAYGLPSVVAGLHATTQLVFKVPPQVFVPAPRVESAVVRLVRKSAPAHAEEAIRIATAGFGQRRKMIRTSLRNFVDETQIRRAHLDPQSRAEDLSPDDFLRLAAT